MSRNSDAVRKAKAKYDKKWTRQVKLKLHIVRDADVLEVLDAVGNKQGYIKRLIRDDVGVSEGEG